MPNRPRAPRDRNSLGRYLRRHCRPAPSAGGEGVEVPMRRLSAIVNPAPRGGAFAAPPAAVKGGPRGRVARSDSRWRECVRLWPVGSLAICCLAAMPACSVANDVIASGSPLDTITPRYVTTFPDSEWPISQRGRWLNGGDDGLEWTNVSTTPRRAIGHQVGARYTDGTAILNGSWAPDQKATAIVFSKGRVRDICLSEVELRLRTTIHPHRIQGYEVSYKVSRSKEAYVMIVRWNGELGDFKVLVERFGAEYGVANGDTVGATVIGSRITAYKNGRVVAQATDDMFQSGSPGIGFNLENSHAGCPGTNDQYGFSNFSAADFRTSPGGSNAPHD